MKCRRPDFPHDLKREVDLYATGANVHDLRSAWASFVMFWERTPDLCSDAQVRRLESYERAVRVLILKCKPMKMDARTHGVKHHSPRPPSTLNRGVRA